jgi:hypothetical protein
MPMMHSHIPAATIPVRHCIVAVRQYGLSAFKISAVETMVPLIVLDAREAYWIDELQSPYHEGVYNLSYPVDREHERRAKAAFRAAVACCFSTG